MPVEVDVSERCKHGCFTVQLGSDSIWRFHAPGNVYAFHYEMPREDETLIHAQGCSGSCADEECWDEEI